MRCNNEVKQRLGFFCFSFCFWIYKKENKGHTGEPGLRDPAGLRLSMFLNDLFFTIPAFFGGLFCAGGVPRDWDCHPDASAEIGGVASLAAPAASSGYTRTS